MASEGPVAHLGFVLCLVLIVTGLAGRFGAGRSPARAFAAPPLAIDRQLAIPAGACAAM